MNSSLLITLSIFLLSACTTSTKVPADWKTYNNSGAHVSFHYPSPWTITKQQTNAPYQQEEIAGPEGRVVVTWGEGIEGKCSGNSPDYGWEKMTFNGHTYDVCHEGDPVAPDPIRGSESWRMIDTDWGLLNPRQENVDAIANAGESENKKVILNILSTLAFNK